MQFLKIYILVTALMFVAIVPVYFAVYIIAPGSYARSEIYLLDIPYEEAENIMADFKKKNPKYLDKENLDGIAKPTPTYRETEYVIFNLPNINYEAGCKLLPIEGNPSKTKILLTGASSNKGDFGGTINTKKLGKEENNRIKKEFEDNILDNLGKWTHRDPIVFRYIQSN